VLRGLTQPTDDDWTIIFDAAETNWILFYSSSSPLLRGSDGSSPVAMYVRRIRGSNALRGGARTVSSAASMDKIFFQQLRS
jgi:hypothetical protein